MACLQGRHTGGRSPGEEGRGSGDCTPALSDAQGSGGTSRSAPACWGEQLPCRVPCGWAGPHSFGALPRRTSPTECVHSFWRFIGTRPSDWPGSAGAQLPCLLLSLRPPRVGCQADSNLPQAVARPGLGQLSQEPEVTAGASPLRPHQHPGRGMGRVLPAAVAAHGMVGSEAVEAGLGASQMSVMSSRAGLSGGWHVASRCAVRAPSEGCEPQEQGQAPHRDPAAATHGRGVFTALTPSLSVSPHPGTCSPPVAVVPREPVGSVLRKVCCRAGSRTWAVGWGTVSGGAVCGLWDGGP